MPKIHEPPLQLELKPSKRLRQLLILIHGLALGSSIANSLPDGIKLALLGGICLHLWLVFRRLKSERVIIKQSEASGWEISNGHGFTAVQILGSTVITAFTIFLHFSNSKEKRSVLIVNDSLSEADYRRLIVRLKTT